MPLYEYECDILHTKPPTWEVTRYRFEKIRPWADMDAPIPCPLCAGATHRVLSTFNFQFSQFLQELSAGTII